MSVSLDIILDFLTIIQYIEKYPSSLNLKNKIILLNNFLNFLKIIIKF